MAGRAIHPKPVGNAARQRYGAALNMRAARPFSGVASKIFGLMQSVSECLLSPLFNLPQSFYMCATARS